MIEIVKKMRAFIGPRSGLIFRLLLTDDSKQYKPDSPLERKQFSWKLAVKGGVDFGVTIACFERVLLADR